MDSRCKTRESIIILYELLTHRLCKSKILKVFLNTDGEVAKWVRAFLTEERPLIIEAELIERRQDV